MICFTSVFNDDCDIKPIHEAWTANNPTEAYRLSGITSDFITWCIEAGKFFAQIRFAKVSVDGSEPYALHDIISQNEEFDAWLAFALTYGNEGVDYGNGCNMAGMVKVA